MYTDYGQYVRNIDGAALVQRCQSGKNIRDSRKG